MTKKLSATAQWMLDHPDDEPPLYEDLVCKGCQKVFRARWCQNRKFCSVSCFHTRLRQHRQQRYQGLAEMYETGATLKQIGEHFGITGERVRQIILGEERRARQTAMAEKREYEAKHGPMRPGES